MTTKEKAKWKLITFIFLRLIIFVLRNVYVEVPLYTNKNNRYIFLQLFLYMTSFVIKNI